MLPPIHYAPLESRPQGLTAIASLGVETQKHLQKTQPFETHATQSHIIVLWKHLPFPSKTGHLLAPTANSHPGSLQGEALRSKRQESVSTQKLADPFSWPSSVLGELA